MAGVVLKDIRKAYGQVKVIHGIDLEIRQGEFVVFVGPSGCGKSTLLRMIAGLETITGGEMYIDGQLVNEVPPSKRGIAMVFQSYALYPHMTVYDNMAFGMRIAKENKAEIDRRVRAAADILQLTPYLDRLPKALSGGQRQRVAIGRAICRDPKVFLFDEPLSNLDAALRVATRIEIAKLNESMPDTTMIYVTHDQVEAMTLADRIIVLRNGRIEQVGSPRTLYDRPANIFVAQFLGTPRMNILPATIADDGTAALADGRRIALPLLSAPPEPGTPVSIGIRPEDIRVGTAPGALSFTVGFIERLGGLATIHLQGAAGSDPLACQLRDDGGLREGERVQACLPSERLHLFDANGAAMNKAGEGP